MSSSVHVSKLDAGKRELEFSIRLFFLSGDPIVLHLIISSCQNILRDLCKNKKIVATMDHVMDHIKTDKRKYVKAKIAEPYNFFHHADKDPDGIVKFFPESNEFILFECVERYQLLTTEITGIMTAFRGWFYAKNQEILRSSIENKDVVDAISGLDIDNKINFIKLGEELEKKRMN